MKEAILVSSTKEGVILTQLYPFSEELYTSLLRLRNIGDFKVERCEAPAYLACLI